MTPSGLLGSLRIKGYKVFDRPYELNIVGIRNTSTKPNSFDDKIAVLYKDDSGKWNLHEYDATTDTGTYWLLNPMASKGSALLKEGQYKDSHKIGVHRGKYTALVQQNPVTVIRDYNRDAVLDFNNGREETGIFGINIHRANSVGTTKEVDQYSAGGQVFSNAEDFAEFLTLAQRHKDRYGNNFTYTLIDQRAIRRTILRRSIYALVVAGLVVSGVMYFRSKK